jgi:hypothetical protein
VALSIADGGEKLHRVNRRRVHSARAGGRLPCKAAGGLRPYETRNPRVPTGVASRSPSGRAGFQSAVRRATLTDVREDAAQAALEI